jgi:hypothetical protein
MQMKWQEACSHGYPPKNKLHSMNANSFSKHQPPMSSQPAIPNQASATSVAWEGWGRASAKGAGDIGSDWRGAFGLGNAV